MNDTEALALKPGNPPDLNTLIEPGLQVPPPRPVIWAYAESAYRKMTPEIEALLTRGTAARAWVTEDSSFDSSGPESGPCIRIRFCFEACGGLVHGKFAADFDLLHLGYGAPDYMHWLFKAFKAGGTFTVLYHGENPEDHRIFGALELFLKTDLVQAAEALEKNSDPDAAGALAERFLRIALGPLGKAGKDWKEYFGLMRKMGFCEDGGGKIRAFDKNLEIVKTTVARGSVDRGTLASLSALCGKYCAGLWAAK